MDIDTGKNKDAMYVSRLIIVQSAMKSYLEQKRTKELKKSKLTHGHATAPADPNTMTFDLDQEAIVSDPEQIQNKEFYLNPVVEDIAAQLGDFEYGVPTNDGVHREKRETVLFENDSRYVGEWNIGSNQRDGKGVQIWADGSK